MRTQDRDAVLFDMGLGQWQVDVMVRTADPKTLALLRAAAGRSIFDPAQTLMGDMPRLSPHRVFATRCGRIEVYQPIPPADGRSPDGPHTHVLPKLLRHGRTRAANLPISDGLVPCLSLHFSRPDPNHAILDTEVTMTTDLTARPLRHHTTLSPIWIFLVAGVVALSSFALACATPFAALAAVSGTRMRRRDALATTGLAGAANQTVGFLVLHYPLTPSCFGWGAAIGLAALAATGVAGLRPHQSAIAAPALALLPACLTFQAVLFAATAGLPTGSDAFSLAVIVHVVVINAVATLALITFAAAVTGAAKAYGRVTGFGSDGRRQGAGAAKVLSVP